MATTLHRPVCGVGDPKKLVMGIHRDEAHRVVRKLKAVLPSVRDETVHADLTAMLASDESNTGLVAAELPVPEKIGASS